MKRIDKLKQHMTGMKPHAGGLTFQKIAEGNPTTVLTPA